MAHYYTARYLACAGTAIPLADDRMGAAVSNAGSFSRNLLYLEI